MNALSFIEGFAGAYRKPTRRLLAAIINEFHEPINVRLPCTAGQVGNAAFYRLIETTPRVFDGQSLRSAFHPNDFASGAADNWLEEYAKILAVGGGRYCPTAWTGRHRIDIDVETVVVRGYAINLLRPASRAIVTLGPCLERLRFPDKCDKPPRTDGQTSCLILPIQRPVRRRKPR